LDPGSGTDPRTCAGILDGFLLMLDKNDTAVFTRTWGGPFFDEGRDLVLEDDGTCYVCGYFQGTADFNPYGGPSDFKTSNGWSDAFLAKFNPGGAYQWCTTWGDAGNDFAFTVTRSTSGPIFTGGYFEGTVDFDPGAGVDNHTDPALGGGFLLSLNQDSSFNWAQTVAGGDFDSVLGVTAMGAETVFITGQYSGTVDFNPGTGTDNHTSAGATDSFLVKYFQNGTW